MSKFIRAFLVSIGIGLGALTPAGADEAGIIVDQYHETPQALQFRRAEHPEATYYIPRTHTEARCGKIVQTSNLWTCTASLVRTGITPSELGQNVVFYPFTPESECALKPSPADSRMVTSLKANAVQKIRAQGMTPAGDSGTVCSFEMTVRGEALQVEALSLAFAHQAEANELIESPIKVDLIEVTPVGEPLQAYLAKELELDASQVLTRGEASFLLGIAAGRVPQTAEPLSQMSNPNRAAFYKRGLAGLFVETAAGLRLQTLPINRLSVVFEKSHQFTL